MGLRSSESDGTWKDSEGFEAMLSNRYQRATAQASLKEKAGDNYETTEVIYFGATVLHRRIHSVMRGLPLMLLTETLAA